MLIILGFLMCSYIFPVTVRKRIAELFQDETVVRWWLPNDQGFSPIMRSIRAFADERNETAVSAQSENLREMKTVFAAMRLGSDVSPITGGLSSVPSGDMEAEGTGESLGRHGT